MRSGNTIDKFKDRLVEKGFSQRDGINYFDTYSPMTRITTFRILNALVAIHKFEIDQMDIKTVFLNGDLEKDVYMDQP
jgi:hypothetical protein